ncbi:MAG: hypothetical protein ACYCU0_13795 [Solirubrobacteraceae bacterium]
MGDFRAGKIGMQVEQLAGEIADCAPLAALAYRKPIDVGSP